MIRSLFFVALFFSVTAAYAQRMDQDFTPPAIIYNSNGSAAVYPDMAFTVVKDYDDNGVALKLVNYRVEYTLKYATGGDLYTYVLPEGTFEYYGSNEPKYTKEQFLELPEVQKFISDHSN